MEIADYLHRKEVLAAEKVLLCDALRPAERHMLFCAARRRNAIMTLARHGGLPSSKQVFFFLFSLVTKDEAFKYCSP